MDRSRRVSVRHSSRTGSDWGPGWTSAKPRGAPDEPTRRAVRPMLDYSKSLEIPEHESLSVVARGEEDPIPTSLYDDSRALILKIKGSDLALFYSGKITREEARKRVVETQF